MKTKIGKRGAFAALMAVLLVTTALIISCAGPAGGEGGGEAAAPAGYQPPPGQGYVLIDIKDVNFNDANRSIVPDLTTLGAFTKHTLVFTQYPDDTDPTPTSTLSPITVAQGALSTPINLAPGWYELEVISFIDDPENPGTDIAVATGPSSRFQIKVGLGTPVSVTVSPYDHSNGTANGTFKFNITLTGLTGTISMKITTILGGIGYTSGSTIPITGLTGQQYLPPGYYYVDIVLNGTGGTTGTATAKQVLHIYQHLTSELTIGFTAADIVETDGNTTISITMVANTVNSPPTLTGATAGTIAKDQVITLAADGASATPSPETETITAAGTFTGTIKWFLAGEQLAAADGLSGGNENILTITAGVAPFDFVGRKQVLVEGRDSGGVPHSIAFYVLITP